MAVSAQSVDRTLRTIFKRCVQCPETIPSCPSCKSDEVCSLISQSCGSCASMTCIKNNDQGPPSSGPNVGAIAGGVIGGVFVVALVVFLVWWFVIRGRRAQYEEEWVEDDAAAQKHADDFNMQRGSVHTSNSRSTSLFSRASNMIPIAYIPGVMNRDGRNNSNLNVPPVPPIPAVLGPNSGHSTNGDALFFKPGDLRDSTYSDSSSMDDRSTFYGRPSITPSLARSSVATFRDDAVEHPMPAQTIVRGKANVVSVNSSQKTSPNDTPDKELAGMDFNQAQKQQKVNVVIPGQASKGASIGKPTLLTLTKKSSGKPKAAGRFPTKNSNPALGAKPIKSSPLAYRDEPSDTEEEKETGPMSESLVTPIQESPMPAQSPFADPKGPAVAQPKGKGKAVGDVRDSNVSEQSFIGMGGLKSIAEVSSIIEDATKRASRVSSQHTALGPIRDESPFGDEHETK
ncbi:hypothetical protein AAFC00_000924 [Neodothiora populina]|uniref:Membrane anchor Opy2 N-terminal domain-containing protein n=1 Tax=Neodothiora populina TaxID=2781224 RepID=A0ABR3PM71_9PEZI